MGKLNHLMQNITHLWIVMKYLKKD